MNKLLKDYNKKTKKILKKYDAVLVKTKNIPRLYDKNIMVVSTIEDMINAQMEIRKPVYYFVNENSHSFFLLDGEEALVYIVKNDPTIMCVVEKLILNIDKMRNTMVKETLKKIEKAMLYTYETKCLEDFNKMLSKTVKE
ncbi:MAG: hypothetical protein J6B64_05575 [Bacilli bacterium]|nr:hypothetical protein [Bacilli bacterium]